MFRLDGKAALVTGASGGIGAAIARALHTQGANVALSGTRRDALEALAIQLGDRAHVCPADLRDASEPDALVETAEKATGPLHILVNNAGMTRDMLALRMSDNDWQGVLDVDLSAPFRLTRAVLRGMLRRRAGPSDQYFVYRRRHWERRASQLCRREGRPCGHEQGTGTGSRVSRNHHKCRGAWFRRDPHD